MVPAACRSRRARGGLRKRRDAAGRSVQPAGKERAIAGRPVHKDKGGFPGATIFKNQLDAVTNNRRHDQFSLFAQSRRGIAAPPPRNYEISRCSYLEGCVLTHALDDEGACGGVVETAWQDFLVFG